MNKPRVIIVDDEPLARERLEALLKRESEVEVVGQCGDGNEAIETILAEKPDIVFLDVEMPGCDGLAVVAELSPEERPAVVFVTAHDQFAVDAFAVNAVDYLLKPFDADRFRAALKRAIEHVRRRRIGDLGTRLESILAEANPVLRKPDRLTVKADGRVIFLKPENIVWVEAADNYAVIHMEKGERLTLRETLTSIDKRLGSSGFARVNRSAVVNLDYVKEFQPTFHGDYTVVLHDGTRLPLSRSLRGRLGSFISEDQ